MATDSKNTGSENEGGVWGSAAHCERIKNQSQIAGPSARAICIQLLVRMNHVPAKINPKPDAEARAGDRKHYCVTERFLCG